jgi:hypothetical protein
MVEGKGKKEGEGGRPPTNLWLISHTWPPLNSYFHPPLHLAPIMLTPLIKHQKKSKFLLPFSKVLFIYLLFF